MLVWFAETTIVAGILAGVAMVAGRLRPIPPSARHALWLVVLIKFLTPPLVAWPWAIDWRSMEWPCAQTQACGAVVAAMEIPPSIVPVSAHCDVLTFAPKCNEQDANDSSPAGDAAGNSDRFHGSSERDRRGRT